MFKRTHKNNPLVLAGVIGLAVLVLIILLFFVALFVSKKGPSKAYVQQFQAATVTVDANNTKAQLDSGINSLALPSHGFTALATSYADGCFASNDDSFADWHKACFGREVAYFASPEPAGQTKDKLSALLTAANWKNVTISGDTFTCYGYPLSSILDYNLGFTATYQIEDVNTPCDSPIPEETSVIMPVSDQNNVILSPLSHATNLLATLASAKAQGAKSVIAIAAETEYYNQPLGFYLFK